MLGRRAPAFLPASTATPNIVSESGASDRPVCSALYSSTICRKIGRAIIAAAQRDRSGAAVPRSRTGTSSIGTDPDRAASASPRACGARATSASDPKRHRPDDQELGDGLPAFLPRQDAQDDAAHAEDGEDRADRVDLARSGVRHVLDAPGAEQHDRDDHELEQEADPPREERGDEAAEQWSDRRGDRRRGTDQGIDPLLRGSLEVAVDQRLHRRQQERRAEPTDHGPEHDDRGHALGERHRQRARRRTRADRGRTRASGR